MKSIKSILVLVIVSILFGCNSGNKSVENNGDSSSIDTSVSSEDVVDLPPPSADEIARSNSPFKELQCEEILQKMNSIFEENRDNLSKLKELIIPFQTDIISNVDCRTNESYNAEFNKIIREIKSLKPAKEEQSGRGRSRCK